MASRCCGATSSTSSRGSPPSSPRPEVSLTTNAIGLAERGAGARRCRARPGQRLARLAARRDVHAGHPAPVPRPGARRRRRRGRRRAHAGQDQRGAAAGRQRPRGARTARLGSRRTATNCASSSRCPSTPTAAGTAPPSSPPATSARLLAERFDLSHGGRAARRRSRRAVRRAPEARRDDARPRRTRRHHRLGHRAVLRRLPPHPPDGRGQRAQLPVLAHRDRPPRRSCAPARPTTTSPTLWRGAMWAKPAGHGIDRPRLRPARPHHERHRRLTMTTPTRENRPRETPARRPRP